MPLFETATSITQADVGDDTLLGRTGGPGGGGPLGILITGARGGTDSTAVSSERASATFGSCFCEGDEGRVGLGGGGGSCRLGLAFLDTVREGARGGGGGVRLTVTSLLDGCCACVIVSIDVGRDGTEYASPGVALTMLGRAEEGKEGGTGSDSNKTSDAGSTASAIGTG